MIRGLRFFTACALLLPAATSAAADNPFLAAGDPGSQIHDETWALIALAPVAFMLIFTGIGVLRESRQRRRSTTSRSPLRSD